MKKAQVTLFSFLCIAIISVIVEAYFLRNEISRGISEAKIKLSSLLRME